MRKILLAMSILSSVVVLIPSLVNAIPTDPTALGNAKANTGIPLNLEAAIAQRAGYDTEGTSPTTVSEIIGKVLKSVLSFVGTIFLVLTVYAGILWMTASGNDEQVNKATGIIKMAVIGFVITMSAYSIVYFVMFFSIPQPKQVVSPNCCSALNTVYGSEALDIQPGDSDATTAGKNIGCGLLAVTNVLNPYAWFKSNPPTGICKPQ